MDGEPFVPSNRTPTPQAYCLPDRMTELSRLSRYGMTFLPLTEDRGEVLSKSFRAGFLARTSQSPEEAKASTAKKAASGASSLESFARFDHDSSSWKTPQRSLIGDSESFSETWPRWGSMRNGVCWERTTSKRLTSATEYGSWLATPTAKANQMSPSMQKNPGCAAWTQMLPTPSACSYGTNQGGGGGRVGKVRPSLQTMASKNLWPIPTAHNAKEGSYPAEHARNTPTLAAQAGGQLNPTWVEWLMGWPLAFTDLRPLATDRFRQWLNSHGEF